MKSDSDTPQSEASQPKGDAMSMMTVDKEPIDELRALIGVSEEPAVEDETDLVSDSVKSLAVNLDSLIQQIKADPAMPKLGIIAGSGFHKGFTIIADDIIKMADEHVERAMQTRDEAHELAEQIKRCGAILCRRLEEESVRGFQVSRIAKLSRKMIAES
jgi:hypothetical protein